MNKCKHKTLKFIGTHETDTIYRPLLLFTCIFCHTTVSYSLSKFLNLLLNFKKNDSPQLILSL